MLTQEELQAINRYAKAELTEDQVYTFSVRLCDNEVDRDMERFATEDLERLGELFLGKSGIFDHQWSAKGQTARIYRTEVVREPGVVTAAGDEYRWLKAWAYLMRTEKNQDLITEIEGGIKKEVSVGCSMGRSVWRRGRRFPRPPSARRRIWCACTSGAGCWWPPTRPFAFSGWTCSP